MNTDTKMYVYMDIMELSSYNVEFVNFWWRAQQFGYFIEGSMQIV